MKMKWSKKIVMLLLVFVMMTGAAAVTPKPVLAAAKSYELEEEEKTQTIQLDGKGAKEKIKFLVNSEETGKKDENKRRIYCHTISVYVNNKLVYQKKKETNYSRVTGQIYITSIDSKKKHRDIFISLTGDGYASDYHVLDYCRYSNGKMKKIQSLKNYLDKALAKEIPGISKEYKDNFLYYHAMSHLNESIHANGKGELVVVIDLPGSAQRDCGEYHADYAFKLKNGKLVKRNSSLKGKVHLSEDRKEHEWVSVDEDAIFYTTAGGSNKAFTAMKGTFVFLSEYKIMDGVVYLKGQQGDISTGEPVLFGKTGWIKTKDLDGFTGNHI